MSLSFETLNASVAEKLASRLPAQSYIFPGKQNVFIWLLSMGVSAWPLFVYLTLLSRVLMSFLSFFRPFLVSWTLHNRRRQRSRRLERLDKSLVRATFLRPYSCARARR